MTKEQAEIVLLKRALDQACHSVEFLDRCLVNGIDKGGVYNYIYPEQIPKLMGEWRKLAPESKLCFHSNFDEGCGSCQDRNREMLEYRQARKVMSVIRP